MRGSRVIFSFIVLFGFTSATNCNANTCLREYSTISEVAEELYFATGTDTVRETVTSLIKETATTVIPGTTKTETSYNPALKKETSSTYRPQLCLRLLRRGQIFQRLFMYWHYRPDSSNSSDPINNYNFAYDYHILHRNNRNYDSNHICYDHRCYGYPNNNGLYRNDFWPI
ncbi:hypothetical protein TWF481_006076 [Arthrobotrys musiformis]|uniref:Uncharacterized protein n=1 Tax=Arthrobotrys musiformis TaxID=47236 RepID=A0AAV9WGU5_9PEZI